mmetsp:Transcript_37228/g.63942  ORF Transcript_37228/g.63942 Transcript_37228/m.63942 type:complete len:363 (+) Transcript_37228:157-1245(+)
MGSAHWSLQLLHRRPVRRDTRAVVHEVHVEGRVVEGLERAQHRVANPLRSVAESSAAQRSQKDAHAPPSALSSLERADGKRGLIRAAQHDAREPVPLGRRRARVRHRHRRGVHLRHAVRMRRLRLCAPVHAHPQRGDHGGLEVWRGSKALGKLGDRTRARRHRVAVLHRPDDAVVVAHDCSHVGQAVDLLLALPPSAVTQVVAVHCTGGAREGALGTLRRIICVDCDATLRRHARPNHLETVELARSLEHRTIVRRVKDQRGNARGCRMVLKPESTSCRRAACRFREPRAELSHARCLPGPHDLPRELRRLADQSFAFHAKLGLVRAVRGALTEAVQRREPVHCARDTRGRLLGSARGLLAL